MKVIYVQWLDARGMSGGKPVAQVKKMSGLIIDTAGMLIDEKGKAIRIAQDIYQYDEEDGPIARDVEIIPKKYVITKRIIEIEGETCAN